MAEETTTEIHLEVAINKQWTESNSTQIRSKAANLSKETFGIASVVYVSAACHINVTWHKPENYRS